MAAYKEIGDSTLTTGDYIMVQGAVKRVIHITDMDGEPKGIIVQAASERDNAQLRRQEAEVCRRILTEYIKRVRSGAAQPSEETEAYLCKCFHGKYLGNGRFDGIDNP